MNHIMRATVLEHTDKLVVQMDFLDSKQCVCVAQRLWSTLMSINYQLNNCLVGFCNFIVQRLSSPLFYIGKLRYRMILYKCLEMFYNNTQLIQTELNQTKVNHTELSHIWLYIGKIHKYKTNIYPNNCFIAFSDS